MTVAAASWSVSSRYSSIPSTNEGGLGGAGQIRCEGVKKVDQRWMMEQVDKRNGIIAKHARRRGFMYADPNGLFAGHELCGEDSEWFFP